MKKLSAILLLAIYIFNFVGYPMLFRVLIVQAGKQLSVNIDRHHYLDKDLIEMKVPLNTPYVSSWAEYQRYEGEITINGAHYSYVKRKVSGDTLYLMCLPNQKTNNLYAAKTEYGKKVNDFASEKKGEEGAKKVNLLLQYQEADIVFTLLSPELLIPPKQSTLNSSLLHSCIDLHGKPPEANS